MTPVLAHLRNRVVRPYALVGAVAAWIVCVASTALHYLGTYYGNDVAWISWIVAVGLFGAAFLKVPRRVTALSARSILRSELGIAGLVLLLYLPTHLWNFATAPWNTNGLFDDAAWDIYFAKAHAFVGPFQAAFFDTIGYISRETVFHYYITAFFKLFGYNLLIFTTALLVLGFVTVLFTTLIVHRLFRNPLITVAAALVLNFFPLQYVHIFVGHRYAIAAPLMMVSLYGLYSGFQDRSCFRLCASALFAALCLDSAIMGKQYILGLALAALLIPLVDRPRWRTPEFRAMSVVWVSAFLVSATPLLLYVASNVDGYFGREGGLVGTLLADLGAQGLAGIKPYVEGLAALFLAPDSFTRQWLHDFPLIPFVYYPLLVVGLVVAGLRRRLEIVFLALIPVGSALVSGAFDFRVVLAAPIWILAMAYALDAVLKPRLVTASWQRPLIGWAAPVALALLVVGVLPSAKYLWDLSQNTHALYLLPHRDVGVARFVQDIVAGAASPSPDMKIDEFNRGADAAAVSFDTFVCPGSAFAIMHVYLEDFDDRRMLSFCDQGIEGLKNGAEITRNNVTALAAYVPAGRDLKLIWEEHPNAAGVIDKFRHYDAFGTWQTLGGTVDDQAFALDVLTVPADQVAAFQRQVAADYSEGRL